MRDHPTVFMRDCRDCQKYIYDEETGERQLWRGQPHKRPENTKPPCGYPGEFANGTSKCPKGTPDSASDFFLVSMDIYNHYVRCAATNRFPDDGLVADHAVIFKAAEGNL